MVPTRCRSSGPGSANSALRWSRIPIGRCSRTACCAAAIDFGSAARSAGDRDAAKHWQELTDLLIPLSKSLCTDVGCEMTSLAVQIHGEVQRARQRRSRRWTEPVAEGPVERERRVVADLAPIDGEALPVETFADQSGEPPIILDEK